MLRLARIWASRVNRARRAGSLAKASGRIFSATLAVELRVAGLPDLAHAPLTEEGGDVVVPEAGASGQGHGSVEGERVILPDECWLVLASVVPSSFARVFGPLASRECCPVPSSAAEFVSFLLAVRDSITRRPLRPRLLTCPLRPCQLLRESEAHI